MPTVQELHQEAIGLLYRTHQIYCGIKGKDISLMTGNPPGRTDAETFISIPIEDPEADLIHKHEWMHIFFKSNLRARAAFVDAYVRDLSRRSQTSLGGPLAEFLHQLINSLDDLRVCSLWELIYPQSAEEVAERWRSIVVNSKRYQHDLVMYLMGLGLGLEDRMDRSEWSKYRTILFEAVQQVRRTGFTSCLITARWVVDSILQDLQNNAQSESEPVSAQFLPPAAPPPVGSRLGSALKMATNRTREVVVVGQQDQVRLIQKMVDGSRRTTSQARMGNDNWKLMDTDQAPPGPDPEHQATQASVQAALGISSQAQILVLLQQGQIEIDRVITELKNHTLGLTPRQRLLRGLDSQVSFQDIKPSQVKELRLSRKDLMLVQTMRHSFVRLMDRRQRVRGEAGTVLDPTAYVDLLVGSGDGAIFEEEESARGFSAMVLLDMSGSMKTKWKSVSRACKVLSKAMKFPFSRFEVWGFTSVDGKASILRFEDPERGYELEQMRWGLTPLHIALEVGIRRMQMMPGSAQHIFALTDGMPTHIGHSSGRMTLTEDLVADVSTKVEAARRKRVNVAALLSGYDVSDEVATTMFGGPRFWTRIDSNQEDLFEALVGLVKKAFVTYLRRS